MKYSLLLFVIIHGLHGQAQTSHVHKNKRKISFPNVPGYLTLKTDLHIHTVFSDGKVWPNIRIQEAKKDGLDAVSMTEHLEYQPHKADIPHPDRNRSHHIAVKEAKGSNLIVIKGSEITRSMPPGHSNAIFIEDANKLLIDKPEKVFKEAHDQGAFTFWNHPNWTTQVKDGVARLTKMHESLIKRKHLNGIEVVNEHTYSKEALQIALDNNLTIMGTSDVHGLVDWDFHIHEGGHRPVTLVFAKERNAESIKEALFGGRTAVWYNELLIGKEENIGPLLEASIKIISSKYIGDSQVLRVVVDNNSDVKYSLMNRTNYSFHKNDNLIEVIPNGRTILEIKTLERKQDVKLVFEVLNAVIAPDKYAKIEWSINTQ